MIYDKDATIQILAALKDGDKPLREGDTFHHPEYGPMRVSRVLGWKSGFQLVKRKGAHNFDPIRSLTVTAFREGAKKAQRVNFVPSKAK